MKKILDGGGLFSNDILQQSIIFVHIYIGLVRYGRDLAAEGPGRVVQAGGRASAPPPWTAAGTGNGVRQNR